MKIKASSKIESKLQFVKILKSYSNYGLRESKDIADWLCENLERYTLVDISDVESFKKDLKSHDLLSNIHIFPNERHLNMLKLGIGEDDEYLELLSDYLTSASKEDIKNFLKKLNKEQLIKLSESISI
jgi:hypothetical protein